MDVVHLNQRQLAARWCVSEAKQPHCMSLLWFQRNPLPTEWGKQLWWRRSTADPIELSPFLGVFVVIVIAVRVVDGWRARGTQRQRHVPFERRLPPSEKVQGVLRADELPGEPESFERRLTFRFG